ncbi:MAG: RNA polymerase sigma factor [Eubacterium sp.]
MPDKQLIISAKNGDKDAFCELYSLYKGKLYHYAFYRLKNEEDAKDAVQDCIVSAFAQIRNLRNPDAFCSWIFRILYCACNAIIKNQIQQRQSESIDDFNNDAALSTEDDYTSTELKQALGILKDDEKDIVLLAVVAGFKSREIAKITGMTPGSVRSKLSRSLAKMKNFLE